MKHNYKMPYPFKPGKVHEYKETRGGESETVPPPSTILSRSSANQGRSEPFHGFKSRGKVKKNVVGYAR